MELTGYLTQRIAHEKVESQRRQLEEQERQVAALKARVALLEGDDGHGSSHANSNQGGSSVDDFSIRVRLSSSFQSQGPAR